MALYLDILMGITMVAAMMTISEALQTCDSRQVCATKVYWARKDLCVCGGGSHCPTANDQSVSPVTVRKYIFICPGQSIPPCTDLTSPAITFSGSEGHYGLAHCYCAILDWPGLTYVDKYCAELPA
uniref:Gsp_40 putative toxin n=1 Tax=Gemmula speciosa TaxID=439592 RepID=A0A098LXT6_GEMSP